MKIKNRKIKVFLSFIFFKILLELSYFYQVSPIYSYLSLNLNYNSKKMIFSYLVFFLIMYLIPTNYKKPSSYLIQMLIVLMWIPISAYYWLSNQSTEYFILLSFCFLILFLVPKIDAKINLFYDNRINLFFTFTFGIYFVTTLFLIIKGGGFDIRTLNFDNLYGLRSENKMNGILGYILNWNTKVFFPFYSIYFISNKKKKYAIFTLLMQLSLYLSFGNKAFLFSIIFLYFCFFLITNNKWVRYFPNIFSISILLSFITSTYRIGELIIRTIPYRLLFVPAQIQYWYFNIFKNSKKLLYSESFLGILLNTKKDGTATSLLINKYFTNIPIETNSNTGVFGAAYSNGGFISMVIATMIIFIILLLLDSYSLKLQPALIVSAFSYSIFILSDTSLLVSLNTGGIVLLLLLLFFYTPQRIKER